MSARGTFNLVASMLESSLVKPIIWVGFSVAQTMVVAETSKETQITPNASLKLASARVALFSEDLSKFRMSSQKMQ